MTIPLVELLLLGLLGLVFVVVGLGHYKFGPLLNGPLVSICIGIAFSAIVVYGGATQSYTSVLQFKPEIFLYALLPTIITDGALNVDVHLFLLNFGTICNTAFLGTTISAFIIGVLQWGFGQAKICYAMPFLPNLVFGSLVSATDPVSVLAVFQELQADGNLFVNVFGESVLNDAVAMVLFDTVDGFIEYEGHSATPVNAREVWRAIGVFIGIFTGSVCMGLGFGFALAAIMRTGFFKSKGSIFETGLVVVFLYASYFAATVAHISGIVTLLFCGMVSLLDIFLFVYIGITLFTLEKFNVWRYAALCLISLGAGRLAGIIPCCGVPNIMRPPGRRLGWRIQFLLWWSGLRGAMAFTLSSLAAERYGEQGRVMETCVFYMIFITVVFNGGSIGWLLTKLKMRESDRLASLGVHVPPVRSDTSECSVGYSDASAFGSKFMGSQQQISPSDEEGRPVSFDLEARAASRQGRGCLSWVQSHNLAFYKAMMAVDHRFLSKWFCTGRRHPNIDSTSQYMIPGNTGSVYGIGETEMVPRV
ncbi:Sodium/hydrogen exchanger family-domain-containing protein [Dunaliella salina]|uniref:Sodium/hydrogen exchanger family-domain-containing protein n=1 Tax=Dunaliella salina TaxID=3046 RepID=A0ABQ7GVL8_DUNSA|nr:Sodium/hydrogen exchanger family-domain-containing protein [Dunaliella salina]|eukprot:KAF5838617.1 Sodium/hydrogen exchanger family-domain-containing protein [Dunaliella salina]